MPGRGREHLLSGFPVGLEVVLAAQPVVVDPGRMEPRRRSNSDRFARAPGADASSDWLPVAMLFLTGRETASVHQHPSGPPCSGPSR